MKYILSIVVSFFISGQIALGVSLPAIFGDHMVLQQNAEVTIWGWGKPMEEITVTPSWNNIPVTTVANSAAKWQLKLKTPIAGEGPYSLIVKGYNTIQLKDVLLGEVWFCSGQSNMEWSPRAGIDNIEQIKNAAHPEIRYFSVQHRTADAPQIDLGGNWAISTPESTMDFSAIAYFFGRELQENLNVPIGLINSSWGGTPAEVWVNEEVIADNERLSTEAAKIQEMQWGPKDPGKAYNAMVAPLIPYQIAGALWYQGESNTYSPEAYTELLSTLIKSWRSEWGYEFPFYYVQIAPYSYGRELEGAVLRDAQRKTLEVPGTGMVVISDIGNVDDIHPRNKLDVGLRLANLALNKTYEKTDLPVSGPLYRDMKVEGKKIRLLFDYTEEGLIAEGGKLIHFEIAGEDKNFVPAKAKIDGNTVVVFSKEVKKPVAVRFAFTNKATPNLFNKKGLPASTFRTDDWEIELK